MSIAVCALAVAGVAVRKPMARVNQTRATSQPRMSANHWDDEDEEQLFREMHNMKDSTQQVVRGPADHVLRNKHAAYVVIFNQGTMNEGVYTLESEVGGSKAQLLTFDNAEDAHRFAHRLQGEDFEVVGGMNSMSLAAQPLMWDARRISEFCHSGDFQVALVPAGGMITPPENNTYDPARFGRGPQEDRFQSRTQAQRRGQSGLSMEKRGYDQRPSMWNDMTNRSFDQRRRAEEIQRRTNMTPNQNRGQEIWAAAMRNADGHRRNAEELCGIEECGLDQYPGERNLFEKLYDEGPFGPDGPGPWPQGPGRFGP
jgi:hypothetical protein